MTDTDYDVLIIGGGVNGCGIARDAVGRGLRVALCEQNDLGSATSSASTKLFHGGLRYLEHYEFSLVRKALKERETLLANMPHIAWPLRFVIPHLRGMRPAWMLRMGLFLYDHIGGGKTLPGTKTVKLDRNPIGAPLADNLKLGFEYSDCWVHDSRLVVLNARDAADRAAKILPRMQLETAIRKGDHWQAGLVDTNTGQKTTLSAKALINAAGPWVVDVIENKLHRRTNESIRLVRGSHIVTRRLYSHDKAFFFQNDDGRLIFSIPFEKDFTLIGTTDVDHQSDLEHVECTPEEVDYLCQVVSRYFENPISKADVVWSYSGVRPLHDEIDGKASTASRDYEIKVLDENGKAPLINIFGGKITTYRKLSEEVVAELSPYVKLIGKPWTDHTPLPGGDFPVQARQEVIDDIQEEFPFLSAPALRRLFDTYGTRIRTILKGVNSLKDMGKSFGADLTEIEVRYLMDHEWAENAEDVVWRRTKLGLRLNEAEISNLDTWMNKAAA